jgi:phage tail sheath gpL-like
MSIIYPKRNVSLLSDTQTQSTEPIKVLIVGQKVSGGTATSGELQREIANDNSEDTLFGANSEIAGAIRAFKQINQVTRLDAIALDDEGGANAATGSIAFGTGPAGASGTYTVSIGSRTNHQYTITVASGDTVTDIGDALVTAVTADTDAPFSASNSTGTVTITAANKGPEGNEIGLEISGSITGVTTTVTGMTSGATAPTLTTLFDPIANERYQIIVYPNGWGNTFVTTNFLDGRFNSSDKILDGVAFSSFTDTVANLITAGNAENSQSLVLLGNETVNETLYKGSSLFELNFNIAAQVAAVNALRLTQDATLAGYMTSNVTALDNIGGPHMASMPLANTPFSLLPVKDEDKTFTQTEIDNLNDAGISVLDNNVTNASIIAGKILTTYKTDAASNPDTTWEKLAYVQTASAIREYQFNNLGSDYAQARLTEGDLISGRTMANEAKITASLVGYYNTLSGVDYVLAEAGETALQFFKDNLTVTIDKSQGKVTITEKIVIVTQVDQFIVPIKITFSTT